MDFSTANVKLISVTLKAQCDQAVYAVNLQSKKTAVQSLLKSTDLA